MTEPTPLKQLYPPIEPYNIQYLEVGDGHVLYLEESGNPKGIPVINLHGGPGSGCNETHRRRFNPQHYRIICFDQRGAGRSKPLGSTQANTTQHLIADIELIRKKLSVEKWVVYGYSWGSTLGLAYAEAHPQHVQAMLLGGVLLGTKKELEWISHPSGVAAGLFPEAYTKLMNALDNPKPSDFFKRGYELIKRKNKSAKDIAKYWVYLDMLLGEISLSPQEIEKLINNQPIFTKALLQKYYAAHNFFLISNQLTQKITRIKDIPLYIVHGRLDLLTPPQSVIKLTKAIPNAHIQFIHNTGHGGSAAMESARIEITDKLAQQLR